MACRRPGDKPLSQPIMFSLLTHIGVSRPKWVNIFTAYWVKNGNKPILQIPECNCSISHNAPFKTEMCTFLFWMGHCRIWNRCILGFWIRSIHVGQCYYAVVHVVEHFVKPANHTDISRIKWSRMEQIITSKFGRCEADIIPVKRNFS